MIIKLSEVDKGEALKILKIKDSNISDVELINILLSEEVNNVNHNELRDNLKEEDAMFLSLLKKAEVDKKDPLLKEVIENNKVSVLKCLNKEDYINDEFIKCIKNSSKKNGDWILTTLSYKPYEIFVYDEIDVKNDYFNEIVPIGYFKEEFPYFAVIQDELIWMSVIPHEINTMKKPINDAYGDVLVLGLGLGYYAFHVSNKEDVDKVTIIEKDKKVISLFKENILPYFPNKDKIRIIEDDAFNYLNENHSHDFVFCDIYHNVSDGIGLYLKTKYFENIMTNSRFEYWIETSLLSMMRRQLLTVFEEQYLEGLTEKDYLKAKNENDVIINKMYFYTKDLLIDSIDKLKAILQEDYLKEMAMKLFYKD